MKPLYVVSAILGVSSALWVGASLRSKPDPSEEKFALKDGFTSYSEYRGICALIDERSITSVSAGEASLLRTVMKRTQDCRWWALGAVGNLQGPALQEQFLPDVRPYLEKQPPDLLARTLLESWERHNGAATIDRLCKDQNQGVASLAESVRDEGKNLPKM